MVFIILVLFFGANAVFGFDIQLKNITNSNSNSRGNILYVGGSGPNNYTRIQDAVDNASDGDTVFAYGNSSPYYENVVLERSINLVGEDKQTTVIDANYHGSPLEIFAEGCSVSGFTIRNIEAPESSYGLIMIYNSHVTIKDNFITLGDDDDHNIFVAAIYIRDSNYCIIQDNYIFQATIFRESNGIVLSSSTSYNVISGNEITGYRSYGIATGKDNHHHIISKNYIHHNGIGIEFWGGYQNEFLNNRIEYNRNCGMSFIESYNNIISNNIISNNGYGHQYESGIFLTNWYYFETYENIIKDNEISFNNPTGIYIRVVYDNVITRNNFIDNYGRDGSHEKWWGNAFFDYNIMDGKVAFRGNIWKNNYWSDSQGVFIKLIPGYFWIFMKYPWFNIDWHPALKPYDIGV